MIAISYFGLIIFLMQQLVWFIRVKVMAPKLELNLVQKIFQKLPL